jgi:predicted branched-subunit amino acid permease
MSASPSTAIHPTDPRQAFWEGVRETVLVVPSYLPFGVVCGVAAASVGLDTAAALALPALVFAGSSQAVLTQFLQDSAVLWIAIISGLVVNLRMAVYSAALAPYLRDLSFKKRAFIAFFLVDNAFASLYQRLQERPQDALGNAKPALSYYLGISCILWPAWVMFCAFGVLAGQRIPASWQLDFSITLSFIAILSGSIRSLPLSAAALAAALAAVLLASLPLKLGMIAACLVGLLAGLLAERVAGVR